MKGVAQYKIIQWTIKTRNSNAYHSREYSRKMTKMIDIYTGNQHRFFQQTNGRVSNPINNVLPGMNPESMMT